MTFTMTFADAIWELGDSEHLHPARSAVMAEVERLTRERDEARVDAALAHNQHSTEYIREKMDEAFRRGVEAAARLVEEPNSGYHFDIHCDPEESIETYYARAIRALVPENGEESK